MTGGTFRRESGNAAGQVVGSYGLRTADGRLRTVNYIADDGGFRAAINTNEPGVEPKDPASVTINKPAIVVAAAPVAPVYAAPAAPIVQAPIVQAPVAPIVQAPVAPIVQTRTAPIVAASAPIWNPPAAIPAAPIAYSAPIPYAAPVAPFISAPSSVVTTSSWSSPYTISNVAVAPATWGYTLGLPPTFGYTIRKK